MYPQLDIMRIIGFDPSSFGGGKGDGSISIRITTDKRGQHQSKRLRVFINFHQAENNLGYLQAMQAQLGCGRIGVTSRKDTNSVYVLSITGQELLRFLSTLSGNPIVLSGRYHDMELLLQAIELIQTIKHLTPEGMAIAEGLCNLLSSKMTPKVRATLPASSNSMTSE